MSHKALELAFEATKAWLDGLNARSVQATATREELKSRIDTALSEHGVSPEEVIQHLLQATEDGFHGSAGGRFFAWVIGGAVPSSIAADWLVSVWDQNAALFSCSPAASLVEETAGNWMPALVIKGIQISDNEPLNNDCRHT